MLDFIILPLIDYFCKTFYIGEMDFYELKTFLALARTLHFTKASREANLSPSALSRLVSRLEDECGTEFFIRNNREVCLTENGKIFENFASKCLGELDDLLSSFKDRQNEVSGTLQVYASVTACNTVMIPFVRKLSEKYPLIKLVVQTGDPAEAANMLRDGKADLAVDAIPEIKNPDYSYMSVCRTPLVFAAKKSSRYLDLRDMSPQDIVSSVPLILPKNGIARERFDEWVRSRNVVPNIFAEAEGNEAVMAIASLGLGIALVPKIVLENGPFSEGFAYHEAGNVLGFYDIGFIQKVRVPVSETRKKLYMAVSSVLGMQES